MWTWLRNFVLGPCTTEPPTPERIAWEKERWWRLPGHRETVPGYYGPDSVLQKTIFVGATAPGWKLFFYWHVGTDPCPPHNHGGRVLSLILWGGYIEERIDGGPAGNRRYEIRKPLSFNWIPTDSYHAVRRLLRKRALTLVLVMPGVQEVCYAVDGKWINLKEYWNVAA